MLHIKSLQNFISIHLNSPLRPISWPLKLRRWDSLAGDRFSSNLSVQRVHISIWAPYQTEVTNEISHLLPQSKAFQDYILPHQSSGVRERHFEVSRVFPDGTWEEKQQKQNYYSKLHLILAVPFLSFPKWVKWNKRYVFVNAVLLKCPTSTKSTMWQDFLG